MSILVFYLENYLPNIVLPVSEKGFYSYFPESTSELTTGDISAKKIPEIYNPIDQRGNGSHYAEPA